MHPNNNQYERRSGFGGGASHGNSFIFVNDQIKAPNIMIIDDEGNNLGIFPRLKALELKDEKGLDLVQIAYNKDKMVSTVKLVDYGKYKYLKDKEDKEKKKKQQAKEIKELKVNYAIGENDLQMKIDHAIQFLQNGHGVRFFMKLKGRENIYADKAKTKLQIVLDKLAAYGKPREPEPKKEINGYSIVLFATKK